ncbi:DUF1501 domain-containing protein [Uliginosibacterium aquaticum]|uniref:DUF1501 domain-containing protein n=1 Tax=Uliginosibacterium aquaticum TaxID=2731212 RepID=A0ABX2IBW4_9RHOO|nr:DUF1501 domain-containing protein [Uliginosibacterium aquaticum]NSL53956.1 DUF1501 domain-containing protein [Uliginosibacterium aquaticum]
MNRRQILKTMLGGGALSALGGLELLLATPAQAQTSSGYRALVCIALYGGNDGANMIVPLDTAGYNSYAAVRGALAIPKASLVPIGSSYGLHPALSALAPYWAQAKLAPVFNVGPLARPTTRAQLVAKTAVLPDNLFSHSDQQNLWESGGASVLGRTGWGGRLMESLGSDPVFALGDAGRLGIGAARSTLALPGPGAAFAPDGSFSGNHAKRRAMLDTLANTARSNQLVAAFANIQKTALTRSASLGPVLKITPANTPSDPLNAAFGNLQGIYNSSIAKQLYQVAKLLRERASVGGSRHVYVVSQSGYDTHNSQLERQNTLFAQLAPALVAFQTALAQLGLENNVTSFTLSDFGRTLKPNSSGGTDHGWGNHHLVLGGAVKGGVSYGSFPDLALGGADDYGVNSWEWQGRWIPGTSVDQYVATLASWMGLSTTQVSSMLPNLAQFASSNLGFV